MYFLFRFCNFAFIGVRIYGFTFSFGLCWCGSALARFALPCLSLALALPWLRLTLPCRFGLLLLFTREHVMLLLPPALVRCFRPAWLCLDLRFACF